MNTFWLKIAGLAIIAVGVIVLVTVFTSGTADTEPKKPAKTIYDQWEEDDKKLTAEPQFRETPAPTPNVPAPAQGVAAQPSEPAQPQFKPLSEEEDVEAQRLWIWVENQRKMGRLPGMGYGQMVKGCREIIQKWPESKYAFLAKRALADLPERYQQMYNITKEEINLGNLK